ARFQRAVQCGRLAVRGAGDDLERGAHLAPPAAGSRPHALNGGDPPSTRFVAGRRRAAHSFGRATRTACFSDELAPPRVAVGHCRERCRLGAIDAATLVIPPSPRPSKRRYDMRLAAAMLLAGFALPAFSADACSSIGLA